MKKIKFLGAAGTVTGSCYLLTKHDQPGLLIDMGMFQGPERISELNYNKLEFDPAYLHGVILTHAHLDHCGRLPLLVRHGFNKKIYMTEATSKLLELTLLDAAHIASFDKEIKPMYTEEDVLKLLSHIEIVDYDIGFEVGGYNIIMRDAGHIMGSASLEVSDPSGDEAVSKIIFSGDLGNTPQDILRPTQLIEKGDVVIMESTYGGRTHIDQDPSEVITNEIHHVEKSGGVLLIPAFSLERTQEILHKIDHLKKDGSVKDSTLVFLDSPMAIKATEIYRKYKELYNKELSEHTKMDDPFDFPGLHITEETADSRKIHTFEGPKVIIAGSGMMTGGRILYHAQYNLAKESTRLLIVGYQGEETLGREILEGAKTVIINEKEILVKAHVTNLTAMSAHADEPKLLSWLINIKDVKKVFLTHGEDESREALSEKIKADLGISLVHLPVINEEIVIS